MYILASALSDVGLHREVNEDRHLIDDQLQLYIVCDGMGGHAAGEVAAELAVQHAAQYVRDNCRVLHQAKTIPDGYQHVLELAEDAVEFASHQLYSLACTQHEYVGMGTTMTLLLVVDDKGVMAHVGDTRLYLMRDEQLHLLSSDHTLANEMVQLGVMRSEEASHSRYASVLTRAIGQQDAVQVETLLFDLLPHDTLLLCSDGLSHYFRSSGELSQLLGQDDLPQTLRRLIETAKSRGGADNITAVALRVAAEPGDPTADVEKYRRFLVQLQSCFLLRNLSLSRLTRVLNAARIESYEAGQAVVASGRKLGGFLLVLEGCLQTQEARGTPRVLLPGDHLGATNLLRDEPSPAEVLAVQPTMALLLRRRDFASLTRRQPKLGRRLLQRLAEHLRDELQRSRSGNTGLSPPSSSPPRRWWPFGRRRPPAGG